MSGHENDLLGGRFDRAFAVGCRALIFALVCTLAVVAFALVAVGLAGCVKLAAMAVSYAVAAVVG